MATKEDFSEDKVRGGYQSVGTRHCTGEDPVSGSYISDKTKSEIFKLRIDVDKLSQYSPFLNIISGELVEDDEIKVHFESSEFKKRKDGTFIGHGNVISDGRKIPTAFSVSISKDSVWRAEIKLQQLNINYTCTRYSEYFRHVTVDIDYSGNDKLLLPLYDTSSHPEGAVDGARKLTVFSVLEDAGIEITHNKTNSSEVDDPNPYTPWTDPELYEVMATHHEKDPSRWNIWILLAPRYIDPDLLGLMFDIKNRKGCAVFTGHEWFKDLDSPDSQIKATAQRRLLHTIVHEIGHSFNLWHSWLKGKPDSLSFMNYDYLYNRRNEKDSYFNNFMFSFDDEEIRFIRHGPVNWVQPGVSPFLLHSPQLNMPEKSTDQSSKSLKFTIKPKKVSYTQMEVVSLELELHNDGAQPLEVESKLDPSVGWVTIYIKDPNGTVKAVNSFASASVTCHIKKLAREERINKVVPLVYGKSGFYFQHAGDYYIKATYTFDDYYVVTDPVNITVKRYNGDDSLLNTFFTDKVGEFIALGGSISQRFATERDLIKEHATEDWAKEVTAICNQHMAHSSRIALIRGEKSQEDSTQKEEAPKLLASKGLKSTGPTSDYSSSTQPGETRWKYV